MPPIPRLAPVLALAGLSLVPLAGAPPAAAQSEASETTGTETTGTGTSGTETTGTETTANSGTDGDGADDTTTGDTPADGTGGVQNGPTAPSTAPDPATPPAPSGTPPAPPASPPDPNANGAAAPALPALPTPDTAQASPPLIAPGTGSSDDDDRETLVQQPQTRTAPPELRRRGLLGVAGALFSKRQPPVDTTGLSYLAPYADALLRLNAAATEQAAAEAEVARLQAMGPKTRARAFPADTPGHDSAAWQADIDRLTPMAEDYARLTALTAAQKAQLFPSSGSGHDEAAYQAALARHARASQDLAALRDLTPDRLQALYPGTPSANGYRTALAQARAWANRAAKDADAAEAEALRINSLVIGPRPLTAAEADYLTRYING